MYILTKKIRVRHDLQIMARTRGLGRVIGRVIGRERQDDHDDVPERRRPTSGTTSSEIDLSNFRKKYFWKSNILIPKLLPHVVKISFGNSFLLFIFSKN